MPANHKKLIRSILAEFLGMTLFVYIGCGSALSTGEQKVQRVFSEGASVARVMPIAMAFGVGILVQAYSFGHISGGHFNPAVTLTLLLTGDVDLVTLVGYFAAQFAGATVGSLLLWASVSNLHKDRDGIDNPAFGLGANGLNPNLEAGNGFLLEFMGTLVLCCTVVMTALQKKSLAQGVPHMAPLAIGFAVFLAHVVLIPFTGCGINPARTFGPALVNSIAGNKVWDQDYWIYYLGPFAASVVAANIQKFVFAEDEEDEAPVATPTDEEIPVKDEA